MNIAAIVIGRNEGDRLIACLDALVGFDPVIYVDSGSTDGSVEAAQARGAQVVALDMTQPFTAARARNAGLGKVPQGVELVQFLDGDCIVHDGWLDQAKAFLDQHPDVAVVCGRRREIYPQASVYNALIDAEWDTPIGEAKACGGDALMRVEALRAVGGYRDDLIAGEEPELCLRLRQAGGRIWRLGAEMTAHDAQILYFSQWWKRSKRAGHAFAEGAALHGSPPERHWVAETRRALLWGLGIPLVIIALALIFGAGAFWLGLIYPLQVVRLSRQSGWRWALFSVLGKFAEARGAISYYWRQLSGGKKRLIEYK
ncbi:glycosyltransferase family 2 protein [Sulfitobacter donghicola]|uniref:Glycosyl transferase n=1 Tax=Sulfitobacter donghicola DSW-25 = KCTC 12864 = JCM 14565 TaxID=1300350 RepID=A0A073IHJ5_9RHOB|nr:glycosyltransferase [Sulfitobacter donghicola]KEJ89254.1 glycosyl transferase [Sulfitobacter donghicola DSW-25 = KCTC 12864 = JCM 14565]KIN69050.1 Glycosyl transferase, family 2 [Sulfitobacter donghicola DSW-25 = KCTC 12864 = JCM 14565]